MELASTNRCLVTLLGNIGYTLTLVILIFHLIPVEDVGGLVWDGNKILAWTQESLAETICMARCAGYPRYDCLSQSSKLNIPKFVKQHYANGYYYHTK
jgi:hypothetical protein